MCFDLIGVTLTPFTLIMNLKETQYLQEMYLHDDFTLSLIITDQKYNSHKELANASNCCFKHFSLNSKGEQEDTIEFNFKDGKS